jgi:pimeloyl-ACP methyl ester carboxylesterase/NADH:ubiquinone oxidoreductase subunit K
MIARNLRIVLAIELLLYAIGVQLLQERFHFAAGQVFALFVGLFLGARAVFAAIPFAFAWFARTPRAPAQRIGLARTLGMIWEEYAATVVLFSVIQPFERWFMRGEHVRKAAPGEHPLLLVHGYQCNRGSWWWLRHQLEAAGYCAVTMNLEPPFGDVEDYAQAIGSRVEKICETTGADKVIVVAHSLGGLAARAWLRRDGARRAASLVTLGTPHGGSLLAKRGPGRNARQMVPGNDWLDALNRTALPAGLPVCVIGSPHDDYVMPQANLALRGARMREIPGEGHLHMLFSKRVRDALLGCLPLPVVS